MRVHSAISLLLFMSVWALLFVSFTNPWYHYIENYKIGSTELRNYETHYYPTKVKIITSNLTISGDYSYKEFIHTIFGESTNIPLSSTKYIKSSFSFSVLAWFTSTVLIVLTFLDMYGCEKRWMVIGKFLGFLVFVFSFLSFVLYIVFKSKFHDDCVSVYSKSFCTNNGTGLYKEQFGFFNGKFFGKSGYASWSPSSGWRVVVIASSISLLGSIYNVIFFNKK